jgi:hypothetical protein
MNLAVSAKIDEYLENERARVDHQLELILPEKGVRPLSLHRAMRYSVFAGDRITYRLYLRNRNTGRTTIDQDTL